MKIPRESASRGSSSGSCAELQRCNCRGAGAEAEVKRCSNRDAGADEVQHVQWCRRRGADAETKKVQRVWSRCKVAEVQRCRCVEV